MATWMSQGRGKPLPAWADAASERDGTFLTAPAAILATAT
jgi:hypothetical protein